MSPELQHYIKRERALLVSMREHYANMLLIVTAKIKAIDGGQFNDPQNDRRGKDVQERVQRVARKDREIHAHSKRPV